jgi:hypothetical protein
LYLSVPTFGTTNSSFGVSGTKKQNEGGASKLQLEIIVSIKSIVFLTLKSIYRACIISCSHGRTEIKSSTYSQTAAELTSIFPVLFLSVKRCLPTTCHSHGLLRSIVLFPYGFHQHLQRLQLRQKPPQTCLVDCRP